MECGVASDYRIGTMMNKLRVWVSSEVKVVCTGTINTPHEYSRALADIEGQREV